MLAFLTWAIAATTCLACGWFASTWVHQRKINFLQMQIKVMRQTATAHTDQARRQIGQLQAELATRPARPVSPASDDETGAPAAARRKAVVPDRFVMLEDGFAQTAIIADGFAPTQMMS